MAGTVSCARHSAPPLKKSVTLWQRLGSWSGRDNLQTESFISASGYLRVKWETSHETRPGAGTFRLTVGSSISGRPLQVVADFQGVGQNTAYVNEDPRTFYALVESSNVDWRFTVDEGFPATMEENPEPESRK
jgi:hypothetical protein